MKAHRKDVTELVPEDFLISPIWEFDLDNEVESDTAVVPVLKLPVDSLGNRIAGTQVRLANGQIMPGMIGNVDTADAYATRHFIDVSIYKSGWVHLARYFDPWYEREGPLAFAKQLGLNVNEIFPIAYDLRACCTGDPLAITGAIEAEPRERLTSDQIMALICRR